ncbi:allergen Fel d 4-like [Rhinolophus ferrumequinum]|uniref:allergen Fel d 4-like n=1 Tax=Rhinolophus ferrumequinum TaxID=59479 RepID=UPI00140FB8F8|nr:allergen Fel d 4-like [Rhinolophus ferrumequinum]
MKLLSLCLGLTLVWAHEEGNHEVVTSNIDFSKISGDWYTVFLASDEKERIEENGDLRIFLKHIQALDSSSVLLKYHKKKNGQCVEFSVVGEETEQDGVYSFFYEGHIIFSIIEAVYGEYAICHTVIFKNEKITQVMELFGHEPDLSQTIKTRFEEICQQYGIPKENILDLTKVDRCLQARGNN